MAKILIVEDNPSNMKLAVFLLKKVGYDVLEAKNAEIGISIAKNELPDLILMDIHLPSMDGFEATRLLKEDTHTRSIPIVEDIAFYAAKGRKQNPQPFIKKNQYLLNYFSSIETALAFTCSLFGIRIIMMPFLSSPLALSACTSQGRATTLVNDP